jgi:type IX secretion system PorP/SprF family membrane protein
MSSSRNKLIAVALAALTFGAQAQQAALNDAYLLNPALLDPSHAGQLQHQFHLGFQQKWFGIEGAPRTLMAAGDFMWNGIGIQASIGVDEAGPVQRTSPSVTLAKSVKIDEKSNISFGFQGKLDSWMVDYTKPRINQIGDPAFQSVTSSGLRPNVGFGLTYSYTKLAYVGISVLDVVSEGWSDFEQIRSHRHLYGGVNLPVNSKNTLKLSAVVNQTVGTPIDMNFHAILANDPLGAAGLVFSPNDGIGLSLSTPYDGAYRIYYSYVYPLNPLSVVTNQSHTIGLSFRPKLKPCSLQGPRYF